MTEEKMLHTLRDKASDGPISIGTTGRVGTLMMQELEAKECKRKPHNAPVVSLYCGRSRFLPTPNCLVSRESPKPTRKSADSGNNSSRHRRAQYGSQHMPMLQSEETVSVNTTPVGVRGRPGKKVSKLVEIVDLKCGNQERSWPVPITNQLKRVSFSKLSG
ncbi:unnamed protein product [Fraxinus pennsylvanica]|uniref:Uncharacterized protein n=1 Tax=Fraxinus pennsylvanica TaxID=56036 RepID=A0AAD2AIV2_9LAMI|nr:unnamed protein product [Fraxinus pennsylvanica]